MKTFAEIEAEFLRKKVLPDFDWVRFEEPSPVVEPRVPAARARVAMVTTAGAFLRGRQEPFALRREGDASFRVIPSDADRAEVGLSHLGYDTRRAEEDLDVVFPLRRLRELAAEGRIGSLAPRFASFMGYSPDAAALQENARKVAGLLQEDAVELVLLAPA